MAAKKQGRGGSAMERALAGERQSKRSKPAAAKVSPPPMRLWIVEGAVTISVRTEVMARSLEEAIAEAHQRPMVSLCTQCSEGDPGEEWTTNGSLDGSPKELRASTNENGGE